MRGRGGLGSRGTLGVVVALLLLGSLASAKKPPLEVKIESPHDGESIVRGVPIRFVERVLPPECTPKERRWKFGDGTQSTEKDPLHTYPLNLPPGPLRVELRVVVPSCVGKKTDSIDLVLVNLPPEAHLESPPQARVGEPVLFDASGSTDPDGRVLLFRFSIDGGPPLDRTDPRLFVTFEHEGNFTLSLTVQDNDGSWSAVHYARIRIDPRSPSTEVTRIEIEPQEATVEAGGTLAFEARAFDALGKPLEAPLTWNTTCGIVDSRGVLFADPLVGECIVEATLGNATGRALVHRVDTTPPVLVLSDILAEAQGPWGAKVDFPKEAIDLVDGSTPVECTPETPSVFPLGTTRVVCFSADSHGNRAEGSFEVRVVDTTPPLLELPHPLEVRALVRHGAFVDFTAKAYDLVDGEVEPHCDPPSGSLFRVGTTDVTCTAEDTHGNVAFGEFSVTVRDLSPPRLWTPPFVRALAERSEGVRVEFVVRGEDVVEGEVPVECLPSSGSIFPLGTTRVVCTARDSSGNAAQGEFPVEVRPKVELRVHVDFSSWDLLRIVSKGGVTGGGTLTQFLGEPKERALVEVVVDRNPRCRVLSTTDREGAFSFRIDSPDCLTPGSHTLVARFVEGWVEVIQSVPYEVRLLPIV